MKYKTHVITALGVSTSLIAFDILDYPDFGFITPMANFEFYMAIIVFGSLLPDIDHSKSFLSRKLGFSLPIRHRGFTHTVYPYFFLMSLGLFYENSYWTEIAFWVGVGALLHSFGDCHTTSGVKLLYFNKPTHVLPKFMIWSSGSDVELFYFCFYSALFLMSLGIIFT